jgi:hypothetical protein
MIVKFNQGKCLSERGRPPLFNEESKMEITIQITAK